MKTITTISLLAVVSSGLSACSDLDANTDVAAVTKFSGIWQVSGRTAANRGENKGCGYGTGTGRLSIEGAKVSGELVDDSGYPYALEGSVDNAGRIAGAFTYKGYDAATFEGTLSDVDGGGAFKDINGCQGTWQARRGQAEPDQPAGEGS